MHSQALDNQKDEAISRTFKQVATNFAEVFKELVPAGHASLIMHRRQDTDSQEEVCVQIGAQQANSYLHQAQTAERSSGRIEQYTGVGIRVSFTGRSDETHLAQQLSGGQKTLVVRKISFRVSTWILMFAQPGARVDLCHPALRPSSVLPL